MSLPNRAPTFPIFILSASYLPKGADVQLTNRSRCNQQQRIQSSSYRHAGLCLLESAAAFTCVQSRYRCCSIATVYPGRRALSQCYRAICR